MCCKRALYTEDFRYFFETINKFNKSFLIIGNINSVTYKVCYDLIGKDKVWLGENIGRGISGFILPDYYELFGTEFKIDENNQKIKTSVSFLLVPVFDASQTNALETGKIKTLHYRNQDETISNEMLNDLYKEVRDKYNIKIEEKKLEPSLGGYYQKNKNLIVINNHNLKSTNSKVGTLFHELGHHLLHGQDNYKDIHLDTGQKEGERESVSYIISKFLDIEQKSELYLKSWDRNAINMKEHLERIVRASKEIFHMVDFRGIFEKELQRQELTKVYLDTMIEDKSVSIKAEQTLSL